MREINCSEITKTVRRMCIRANLELADDVKKALDEGVKKEGSDIGRDILSQLQENLRVAREEQIPICQDTGMTVVFVTMGQDIHVTGGSLGEAINEGIRQGYKDGYLRKSVVSDPIERVNTGDNTPGVIHYDIVPGDGFTITVAPKGFGSENMSVLKMLKPADGLDGVKKVILDAVASAGPNACPPMVVGVGVGGTFESCALMAKRALLYPLNNSSESSRPNDSSAPSWVRELEDEMLEKINGLGIGPAGLGGKVTALGIHIETAPTHIAGLPVAVNICCHVNRHVTENM